MKKIECECGCSTYFLYSHGMHVCEHCGLPSFIRKRNYAEDKSTLIIDAIETANRRMRENNNDLSRKLKFYRICLIVSFISFGIYLLKYFVFSY